jgi:hypothetical protein
MARLINTRFGVALLILIVPKQSPPVLLSELNALISHYAVPGHPSALVCGSTEAQVKGQTRLAAVSVDASPPDTAEASQGRVLPYAWINRGLARCRDVLFVQIAAWWLG